MLLRAGILLLAAACAAAPSKTLPKEVPRACLRAAEGESEEHLLARILVDGCTARTTDEVLIQHTMLLLNACHMTTSACVRKACVRLGDADTEDPFKLAGR